MKKCKKECVKNPADEDYEDRLHGPLHVTVTPYEDLPPEKKKKADKVLDWYRQIKPLMEKSDDED